MMWFKRLSAAAAVLLLLASQALAQGAQFPPGSIWGNDTAAQRAGRAASVRAILDRASAVNGAGSGTLNTYFNGAGKWDTNLDTLGFVRSSSYYEENATVDHGFTMRSRVNPALAYAVPTFRSTKANSPTAMDLWPSGPTPTENGSNGFTWYDSCDADLTVSELTPIRCGRLAMTGTGAEIGLVNFNGATCLPTWFIQGSGGGTARKAKMDCAGLFTLGLGADATVFGTHFIINSVAANPAMAVRDSVNHSEFFAAASSSVFIGAATNHSLNLRTNNVDRAVLGASGGWTVGAPTGGNKGDGTINVTGCFVNNVACIVTDGALGTPVSGVATNLTGTAAGLTAGTFTAGSATNLTSGTLPAARTNGHMNGTATNDNGAAGEVGEYLSCVQAVGTGAALTTTVAANVLSGTSSCGADHLTLTAGDWDVRAQVYVTMGATTSYSNVNYSISSTSATQDVTGGKWINFSTPASVVGNTHITFGAVTYRLSCTASSCNGSGTVNVYLPVTATFTVSTANPWGIIAARRVR